MAFTTPERLGERIRNDESEITALSERISFFEAQLGDPQYNSTARRTISSNLRALREQRSRINKNLSRDRAELSIYTSREGQGLSSAEIYKQNIKPGIMGVKRDEKINERFAAAGVTTTIQEYRSSNRESQRAVNQQVAFVEDYKRRKMSGASSAPVVSSGVIDLRGDTRAQDYIQNRMNMPYDFTGKKAKDLFPQEAARISPMTYVSPLSIATIETVGLNKKPTVTQYTQASDYVSPSLFGGGRETSVTTFSDLTPAQSILLSGSARRKNKDIVVSPFYGSLSFSETFATPSKTAQVFSSTIDKIDRAPFIVKITESRPARKAFDFISLSGQGGEMIGERLKSSSRMNVQSFDSNQWVRNIPETTKYRVGQGFEVTGQFVGGVGSNLRRRPGRYVAAGVIGVLTGGVTTWAGRAAALGSKGAFWSLAGLKGAGAIAGGYYAAGEISAIAKSPRPGERASSTFLDIGSFYGGYKLGASAIPGVKQSGYSVSNTRGVTTTNEAGVFGTRSFTIKYKASFMGREYAPKVKGVQNFYGNRFTETLKFPLGGKRTYSGSLTTFSTDTPIQNLRPGMVISSQTKIYNTGGVQRTETVFSGFKNPYVVRGTSTNSGTTLNYYGTNQRTYFYTPGGDGRSGLFRGLVSSKRGSFYVGAGTQAVSFNPSGFSDLVGLPSYGSVGLPASRMMVSPAGVSPSAVASGFSPLRGGGFISIPKGYLSRIKIGESVRGITSSNQGIRQGLSILPYSRPSSIAVTRVDIDFIPSWEGATGSGSGSTTRTIIDVPSYIPSDGLGPTPPGPIIPRIPTGGFGFGSVPRFGGGGRRRGRRKIFAQAKKYTPSLFALGFNIKGRQKLSNRGLRSGLVVRPI